MDIFDQISADIMAAMKAKDRVRLEALRGVKKEFIEAKTAEGAGGVLTDEAALKIMTKMVKQRKESAKQESAGLEGTKQLHPQNIKVSNIKKLTIGGVEYKM